eukprot:1161912-Pelagomonas_calceolata.AAC.4
MKWSWQQLALGLGAYSEGAARACEGSERVHADSQKLTGRARRLAGVSSRLKVREHCDYMNTHSECMQTHGSCISVRKVLMHGKGYMPRMGANTVRITELAGILSRLTVRALGSQCMKRLTVSAGSKCSIFRAVVEF